MTVVCSLSTLIKEVSLPSPSRWRPWQKAPTMSKGREPWVPAPTDSSTIPTPRLREHCRRGERKIGRAKRTGSLLWECVFYIWLGHYTHEISTEQLNHDKPERIKTWDDTPTWSGKIWPHLTHTWRNTGNYALPKGISHPRNKPLKWTQYQV